MRTFAQTVLTLLLRVAEIVTALLLFVMMMLTFADVIGRYIFTAPIFGAAEMIQFLLALTIFSGLCLVNARDEHITVELFETQIDRWIPVLRPIIVQVFSVGVMVIIARQLYQFAVDAERIGSRTVVLEWPFALLAFTVAGLSAASLIAQVLGLLVAPRPHPPDQPGAAL